MFIISKLKSSCVYGTVTSLHKEQAPFHVTFMRSDFNSNLERNYAESSAAIPVGSSRREARRVGWDPMNIKFRI